MGNLQLHGILFVWLVKNTKKSTYINMEEIYKNSGGFVVSFIRAWWYPL